MTCLPVEAWIRLGFIHPVDGRIIEGLAITKRHLNEKPIVRPAGFKHQNSGATVGRKPVGQNTSGGTSTYNDVIKIHISRILV